MSSNPCLKLLEQALRVARMNLDELASRSTEWRIERYNELRRGQTQYEESCAQNLMFSQRISDLGYFQLARLKLAGSFKLKQPRSLEDPGIAKIAEEFTSDEYDALSKLDRFARLDFLTRDEIAQALFNRQGQIYAIVKQWYDMQMDEFDKLVIPPEAKEGMKGYLATALIQEYNNRFEKIRAGIVEYIRINPAGPRPLFSEYEAALSRAYQAEMERKRAEEQALKAMTDLYLQELERRIEALQSEREQLMSALDNLESLANKSQALSQLTEHLSKNESVGRRVSELVSLLRGRIAELEQSKTQLEKQQAELKDIYERSSQEARVAIEAELQRLNDTNEDLSKKLNDFMNAASRLELEKTALEERLRSIKDSLEGARDKRLVKRDEARVMELNFIGRFDRKMKEYLPRRFFDPIRGGEMVIDRADDYLHAQRDETGFLAEQLKLSDQDLTLCPRNTRSSYTVVKKRLLRDSLKVVVEAAYLSHLESYPRLFHDTKSINLSDFLRFIDDATERARLGEALYVIGLGSPTGFDEGLKKYIASDEFHRNFVSNYVAVCLIDLESGELIYNPTDDRVKAYLDLFDQEFAAEKVERVKRYVDERKWPGSMITLSRATADTKVDARHVKKAFYELEYARMGQVYRVEDDLVFMVGRAA